jgi:uncharacterized protein (TIGR00299 family) protein
LATTLYFDCFSGASGDMILGGLLDLGLPLDDLRAALGSLTVELGELSASRVLRAGVSATKFTVAADEPTSHHHHHQHYQLKTIAGAIERSARSPAGKDRAVHLFERLARVEAEIHDMPVEQVHLHEVGAIDSIVDIVGAVYGLEQLGAGRIVSSPLNVGGGTVTCAHGVFPVPAPATVRLLEGVPVYAGDLQMELVTPTGALLVTGYAESYGPLPPMTITKVGYGAGGRDPKGHPNVLRLITGDRPDAAHVHRVVEIVCEIDDMNPQLFGSLMDRLLAGGALDVFYAAVQMKKNRPGTLVTVLARPEDRDRLSGILFAESTTIGVRYQEMMRECLDREMIEVQTPLGPVRFKLARRAGQVLNASPEFDDCARIAAERQLPVKQVQAVALKAWMER